jgi:hypothetical protein
MRSLAWLDRLIAGAGLLVVIVLAPIAAIYWLVTGHAGNALIVLGVLVVVLAVVALRLRDALPRSRRGSGRP